MLHTAKPGLVLFCLMILVACNSRKMNAGSYDGSVKTANYEEKPLPPPNSAASAKNFSRVIGWKNDEKPTAPAGFRVSKFAEGLSHPRWIYVAKNGDVFVAESNTILKGIKKLGAKISRKIKTQHIGTSENKIILLRDENNDGIAEAHYLFKDNLNQPFGMLIQDDHFYVANTDAVLEFEYHPGDTALNGTGKKIISYPGQGRHWTRNIISDPEKNKLFIAVGSSSNIAENGLDKEENRAEIIEVNRDGTNEKIYASGLRNPCGMAWAPGTKILWAAVNERDELGDELVPDYLTHVKEEGFYGWPYSYYGQHEDPRMKDHQRPDLVSKAIVPDIQLGSHTASLGLLFYTGKSFPSRYRGGAFITQHGSWNRSVISGYKVIFVPFQNGKPTGPPEDFLTGFTDNLEKSTVHGRPVGIAVLDDGSMLVSDDSSNTIWRIEAEGK
ncbi:MAG TPA: sorbosone dehydrogenase family protein [Puia sp.]